MNKREDNAAKEASQSDQSFLLTFSDICHILKKRHWFIAKLTILFAIIALLYGLTRPIEYRAKATFKEKGETLSDLNQSINTLFLTADAKDSEALTLMKSRRLTEELVKRGNLQVVIKERGSLFPTHFFQRIKNNLLVEYARIVNRKAPILPDDQKEIAVINIRYDGEIEKKLLVDFIDDESFEVKCPGNCRVISDNIGAIVTSDDFSFKIIKTKDKPIAGKSFEFTLLPLGKTAETLAKKFTIEADSADSGLLKITYDSPGRRDSANHTTALMELYQDYIYKEHQRICNFQIAYLQTRQEDMGKKLHGMMLTHAENLSDDLSNTGFANYDSAIGFLNSSQQNHKEKLRAIDLEIQWLNHVKKEAKTPDGTFASTLNPEAVNQISKEIRQLKKEADSLALSTKKARFDKTDVKNHSEYASPPDGMDLSIVKELYIAYSKELKSLEATATNYNFIISQIYDPDFEISSLSTVLADPISNEMISKSGQLILALKDLDNRTAKEQERLKATLAINKDFFITHLTQAIQLNELQQRVLNEKIEALQHTNLLLIEDQIAILEDQIAGTISNRLTSLDQEKQLYQENLFQIRSEMAKLPHKWMAEHMIQQQMDLNKKMAEEISKLVESKNLASNIEKIQSVPIDLPLTPIHPKPPYLLLMTLCGALAGAFLGTGWSLIKTLADGIEVSEGNLRQNGQHISGSLSLSCNEIRPQSSPMIDSDLTTLRRVISFLAYSNQKQEEDDEDGDGNIVLLLTNHGPNYSEPLARLLSKMEMKILIIDLSFDSSDGRSQKKGLLQYLEGEVDKPAIEHQTLFDKIYSGGITRFANELIASNRFDQCLKSLQMDYDWILIENPASPLSQEAECLLRKYPKAAISIRNEPVHELCQRVLKRTNQVTWIMISPDI